jgi:hypothetical protein
MRREKTLQPPIFRNEKFRYRYQSSSCRALRRRAVLARLSRPDNNLDRGARGLQHRSAADFIRPDRHSGTASPIARLRHRTAIAGASPSPSPRTFRARQWVELGNPGGKRCAYHQPAERSLGRMTGGFRIDGLVRAPADLFGIGQVSECDCFVFGVGEYRHRFATGSNFRGGQALSAVSLVFVFSSPSSVRNNIRPPSLLIST